MNIKNCNCSNASATTNCGCHNPIELISQGLQGPTGPQGSTGTAGTTVLFSNVATYNFAVGSTGETITIYTIDNTPTSQLANGDYIAIKGIIRYSNTESIWRAFDTTINIGALSIALPRRQANLSCYAFDIFEINLKRLTSTTAYYVVSSSAMVSSLTGTWDTLSTSYLPGVATGALDFTTDLIVSVTTTEMDLTTTPVVALAGGLNALAGASIRLFNIEKYIQ